jgi:hypothetical protein
VAISDGSLPEPPDKERSDAAHADETPISTSGVVVRDDTRVPEESGIELTAAASGEPNPRPFKRVDSDAPSFRELTPYHARLDVEMDDTAVSKVRDPSVSLRLGPARGARLRASPKQALIATSLGALIGVLFVVIVALFIRAFR